MIAVNSGRMARKKLRTSRQSVCEAISLRLMCLRSFENIYTIPGFPEGVNNIYVEIDSNRGANTSRAKREWCKMRLVVKRNQIGKNYISQSSNRAVSCTTTPVLARNYVPGSFILEVV